MVLLASIAWRRSEGQDSLITAVTLLLAFVALFVPNQIVPGGRGMAALFAHDAWFAYTAALIVLSSVAVLVMSYGVIGERVAVDEYYLLLLLGTLGGVVMAGALNDISFFLGLETLSLSLLGLIAYRRQRALSGEAAMKYLVLSGASSAILMFGFALSYAETGSLNFLAPVGTNVPEPVLAQMATVLVLTGMFFKLSAVPFHLWLADVLEGTSIPVAALLSVVSKIGLFAAMLRYFSAFDLLAPNALTGEITAVAILSMLGGNFLALGQTDLKRMLAGSSISHIGYLLIAFLSPGPFGVASAAFYLAAYAASTIGAFAVMAAVPEASKISDWQGMFQRRPGLALAMSVMVASLAGIPPAIGFFAKIYVATAGVSVHHTAMLVALILGSLMGLYYYLRIVRVMLTPATESIPSGRIRLSMGNAVLISALTVVTLVLGLYPTALMGGREQAFAAVPAPVMTAENTGMR